MPTKIKVHGVCPDCGTHCCTHTYEYLMHLESQLAERDKLLKKLLEPWRDEEAEVDPNKEE